MATRDLSEVRNLTKMTPTTNLEAAMPAATVGHHTSDDDEPPRKPTILESIKYRGTLYSTICKLEYGVLLSEYKIKHTKKKMGVAIYDAMMHEDGKVGGGTMAAFEKARQVIQALAHEAEHMKMEMARLASTGEGESVSRPGSPRPAKGAAAFFHAATKQGNGDAANSALEAGAVRK